MLEEILQKISVRIRDKNSEPLGTGIIWLNPLDRKTMYIFTAGHVVFEKETDLKVDCMYDGFEGEYIIEAENIKYHSRFDKKGDVYFFDSAVIIIPLDQEMTNYDYRLCISKGAINDEIKSWGFTFNSNKETVFESGIPLCGKIVKEYHKATGEIRVQLSNHFDPSERIRELKGASGAAFLQENGEYIEYCGLVNHGFGINATDNNIVCASSILIAEILEEFCSVKIERGTGVFSSFSSFVQEAICDFENETVKKIVLASINNMIDDKNITPQYLIDQKDDCYNIPTCNCKSKYKCTTRWKNKLIVISLLNAMGISENEYQNPIIDIDSSRKIPVDFICSEGAGNGVKMGGLIQSIDEKNIAGFNEFRDFSTLIWSSMGVPNRKVVNRDAYNKIIKDISKNPDNPENLFKHSKLDIKNGEIVKKSYSIIHIHKLQEEIDSLDEDCTLDQIVGCVQEVIRSVN